MTLTLPDTLTAANRGGAPPRDELYRFGRSIEYTRDTGEDAPEGSIGVLSGHFAVFDQWTRIDSVYEGTFMERFAPGAFKKTFQEGRQGMRSLFQHGKDPVVGNKPLGPILRLEEDSQGAAYDVGLLDTSYNRDLIPGIQAGLYGASFRFRVMKQDVTRSPEKSDMNPDGIPERTVSEAQVMEFGPVTFPAYAGATAGLRSMTDEFLLEMLISSGRLRELVDYIPHIDEQPPTGTAVDDADLALREVGAAVRHSTSGSRKPLYGTTTGRRRPSWLLETNS